MTVRKTTKPATKAVPAVRKAMKLTTLQRTARSIIGNYANAANAAAQTLLQQVREMVAKKKITEAQWSETYRPAFVEALAAQPTISEGSAKVMLSWLRLAVIGLSNGIDGKTDKPVVSLQSYYRQCGPRVIKAKLATADTRGKRNTSKPAAKGTKTTAKGTNTKGAAGPAKVMTVADMDAASLEYLEGMGCFATIPGTGKFGPADRAAAAQALCTRARSGDLMEWLTTKA